MESEAAPWPNEKAEQMQGILTAFKADYEAGRVKKFAGLIQGDLLSDFLEMAAHLAGENYKDAAAVIAGSVLEEHTRKLAEGRGIEVERADGRAHKFETLNAELRKAEPPTYSEAERKQLAAWYGLRTDAAHARRDEYTLEEVRLMIEGIRGFLIRYPA